MSLAQQFLCCKATITNIITTFISVLHDILYVNIMSKIPSSSKNASCQPMCFEHFSNCRIILDCTEIGVDNTENLEKQCTFYSNYKSKTTLKVLIGVSPNGVITYVSDLYGGSASDRAITMDCGILNQLESGDMVMADKGFTLRDILPQGVTLNIPSFLVNGQFTEEEAKRNKLIAGACIHVERAIQRLKTYAVLQHIPFQHKCIASKLVKVCACLVNMQTPILKEISDRL